MVRPLRATRSISELRARFTVLTTIQSVLNIYVTQSSRQKELLVVDFLAVRLLSKSDRSLSWLHFFFSFMVDD